MTKREKILNTMLRIIAEQGVHATPMSQIAKESGVATGTIYHHFKSKEDILNALYLELKEEFGKLLRNSLDGGLPFKDQFFFTCRSLYTYYIENPLIYVFAEQIAKSPLIKEDIKKQGKEFYQPILNFLEGGIKSGILKDMNVDLMSNIIFGNIICLVQLHVTKELEVDKAILEEAITISWRGVVNI